jgi:NADPH-dependent glutamate synthase beta subunit-like oxidoreductase
VPRYVGLIAEGRFDEAYLVNCWANVFPGVLGRICVHFCESECRRAKIDQPVSICALKRAAADYRTRRPRDYSLLASSQRREERVAIVGSGPAGLAAAHDLALRGYRVTAFEALPVAGGMLNVGIPPYRLPRDVVQTEVVQPLQDLGVEIRVDTALGRDLTLADLKQMGFDAVVLATGCTRSRELQIEGMHLDGVLKGVDFLLDASLGRGVRLGQRVIAVGGGNVAVDVARSALRMPGERSPEGEEIITATDVARSALRLGAPEVHVVCLEDRSQMPAYESEIQQAEEEGVVFHSSLGPSRILGDSGRVCGLETLAVASVFDADGRFNPSFSPNTEAVLEADTVILAIGQSPDLSFLSEGSRVEVTERGMIRAPAGGGATTAPGIFAVGDVVDGPRNVIEVIAAGHRLKKTPLLSDPSPRSWCGRHAGMTTTASAVSQRDSSRPTSGGSSSPRPIGASRLRPPCGRRDAASSASRISSLMPTRVYSAGAA